MLLKKETLSLCLRFLSLFFVSFASPANAAEDTDEEKHEARQESEKEETGWFTFDEESSEDSETTNSTQEKPKEKIYIIVFEKKLKRAHKPKFPLERRSLTY